MRDRGHDSTVSAPRLGCRDSLVAAKQRLSQRVGAYRADARDFGPPDGARIQDALDAAETLEQGPSSNLRDSRNGDQHRETGRG